MLAVKPDRGKNGFQIATQRRVFNVGNGIGHGIFQAYARDRSLALKRLPTPGGKEAHYDRHTESNLANARSPASCRTVGKPGY